MLPEKRLHFRASAKTDPGSVRKNNQDSIHLWSDGNNLLAVIADGMGGAAAGEIASRIAVKAIHEKLVQGEHVSLQGFATLDEEQVGEKLEEWLHYANAEIVRESQQFPELRGMGTTLTLALIRGDKLAIAHVGDSRAYFISRDGTNFVQITADHSFVQALVDAGHITGDEAETHPMKNVLYRALGQTMDLDVDVTQDFRLSVGDKLLLCSDGLTLHVQPHELAEIAQAKSEPDEISQDLINLANERGGKDNISVIVVAVEEGSSNGSDEEGQFQSSVLKALDEPPMQSRSSVQQRHIRRVAVFPQTDGEGYDILEPFQ